MKKKDDKARVLHVIPALMQGGVETVISNIIRHSNPERTEHHILVLKDDKTFAAEFEGLPVTIHYASDADGTAAKLRLAREIKPDVIHVANRRTAMYLAPIARVIGKPLVLGMHNISEPGQPVSSRKAALYGKVEPHVTKYAVSCTERAEEIARQNGWNEGKIQIIPNGIDVDNFTRDKAAGMRVRQAEGIAEDATVIGLPARYTEMKDIPNFIEAARRVKQAHPEKPLCFLLCGRKMDADNKELTDQLKAAGIYEQTRLLGVRTDMPAVYSAMDVLALSSSKMEALSMALLEGTSCGCLCVSTQVGDHKRLMKRTGGICVPPKDSQALADGIMSYLEMSEKQRQDKRAEGRAAIEEHYNVKRMAAQYENMFIDIAHARSRTHKTARQGGGQLSTAYTGR